MHFTDDHRVARIEPFWPEQPLSRPIDLEFGPEGALYLLEYGETWGVNANARLVRIDYVAGNRAPYVQVAAENNLGRPPLVVALSSQGTVDKDADDQLSFEWRVYRAAEGAAAKPRVVSREPQPRVTFEEPGVYNVELVVTDSHGAQRAAQLPVLVGNSRPDVRFLAPQSGDFFDLDQPVAYRLRVLDREDGTNDEQAAEQDDLEYLDSSAVPRTTVQAVLGTGPRPPAEGTSSPDAGPLGMRLMKRSDCFNCHSVDQKRVGPPLLEIATKYRGQAGALETSVQRVLQGSTGVWGKIPMIPHGQHTAAEVREMVSWVMGLEPSGLVRIFHGLVGEIPPSPGEAGKIGHVRLEATYVDRGAGEVPPLSASAVLFLRPRRCEAEAADEIQGSQVLSSNNASGGRFVGAINHGHYLRFRDLELGQVDRVTLWLASAGAGGAVEIRMDQPAGPLLAQVPVEVNGHWEKFYERTVALRLPDGQPCTGRHDIIIRFTHPQGAGGLMNLDAIYFHAPTPAATR
ncbi:MAG: carbohydrate-binding protein [Pirellulales bacterium]